MCNEAEKAWIFWEKRPSQQLIILVVFVVPKVNTNGAHF